MTAKKLLNLSDQSRFSDQSRPVLVNEFAENIGNTRLRNRRRASDNGGNSVAQATALLQFENRSQRNIVGSIVDAQGNVIRLGTRRLTGVARPGRRGTLSADNIPAGTYTFRLTSTGRQPNEYRLRLAAPLPFDCGCGT